ncbi:23S rRNA (uracil(1939)-C(5))-methyltransferase RlmD [Acidithiobacillus sp. IBUN Pt1247-S3]|uniref:23S rRNA (uracil(1939)-C(5))-methyltransferase RlmD n=1 Tax=Acidithiobacillus sp. IBUN Pt1247-S3 TaxID=3166642 RepID=UPI0034E60523
MTRSKPIRGLAPCTLNIASLDGDGVGVGRIDGKVTFVAGALPGERVTAQVYEGTARYDRARLLEVQHASAQRVTPRCPHAGVCGGCSLQHLEASAQLAVKQRHLEEQLWQIGKVRPERILPPIAGPSYGYRRKARLSVRVPATRGVLVGFREHHSSYVAEMESCAVLDPRVGEHILDLRALIARLHNPRCIPQIEVACSDDVAALVIRHLEALTPADEELLALFGRTHGLQIWLQSAGPDSLRCISESDPAPLHYELPEYGLRLAFTPLVFTQVNASINPVLIRRAIALLDPQPGEHIADLFCGLGNFTLPIARAGAKVLGIEGERRLTALASANATANGLAAHTEFRCADLTQESLDEVLAGHPVRKLLIDPPRSGALEILKGIGPNIQRLVYVSCNPDTLARDANFLVQQLGFRLRSAGIVNMFPHTAHVESVALFER